jgi:plasmid stabilization system protein ParE
MARSIIWSPDARADLREIEADIAVSSPRNARRVIERIQEAATKLVDFPHAARMVPELQDPDRRETFVHDYRLMYRVEAGTISILRVVHGRRLMKNVPGRFEEPGQETYRAA